MEALLDQLLEGLSPEEVMGYEKHAPEGRNRRKSRNGHSRQRVRTATAEVELEVPRDREGS